MSQPDKRFETATSPKKIKKRRPLRRLFLCFFVLLVGSVIFLPQLLSTPTAENWLREVLAPHLPGTLGFSDLSLRWFKGISITDLEWDDPNAGIHLVADQIQATPRLWSLLSREPDLGTLVLRAPQLRLNPTLLVSPSVGTQTKSGSPSPPSVLWNPSLHIVIEQGQAVIGNAIDYTLLQDIKLDLALSPEGGRLIFATHLPQTDSLVTLQANTEKGIDALQQWQDVTGDLALTLRNLDLAVFEPVFDGWAEIEAQGSLDGDIQLGINGGRLGAASSVRMQGRDVAVAWPGLQPDRLESRRVDLTLQMEAQEKGLLVQAEARTDFLDLHLNGLGTAEDVNITTLLASPWDATLDVDLPQFTRQLKRTLKLRPGVALTTGRFRGNLLLGQGQLQGDLSLVEVAGTYDDRPLKLSQDIQAHVALKQQAGQFVAEAVEVTSSFARVKVHGNPQRVEYEQHLDLAQLQKELGAFLDLGGWSYEGVLVSKGSIQQEGTGWVCTGRGDLQGVRVRDPNGREAVEPHLELTQHIGIGPETRTWESGYLKLKGSWGQLHIEPTFTPSDDPNALALALQGRDLDLARWLPWAVLFGGMEPETSLCGQARMTAALAVGRDTLYLTVREAQVQDFRMQTAQGQAPFDQEQMAFTLKARLDRRQGGIDVQELTLNSAPLTLRDTHFQKTIARGLVQMKGQVDCAYDWSAVTALITAFVPEGLMLQGERENKFHFESNYPVGQSNQALAGLNAQAALGFDQVVYQGLEVGKTEVQVQITQGLLELAPFLSTVNHGELRFGCRADLTQEPLLFLLSEPMTLARDIHITGPLAANMLKYVNPLFANLTQVSGRLDFECQELVWPADAQAKSQLRIIGSIGMREVQLEGSTLLSRILSLFGLEPARGQRMTVRPTSFTVRDGYVRYSNMQVDIGDNPLNFSGAIGLDDSLDMTITLPYTWSGRTVRVDQEAGDRITVPLTGTLADPRLDTERLLKDEIKRQLEKQIQKGIWDLLEKL